MAAKITRAEAAEIHRLASEEGLSRNAIAVRMGRSHNAVSRALALGLADWPVTPLRQVPPPPEVAHRTTSARRAIRCDLVDGRRVLADVLMPPHPSVANMTLADVVRLQWGGAGRQATPTLELLGKRAVRDGVNLMMAAGRASGYSRAWVAEHGSKWARPRAVAS